MESAINREDAKAAAREVDQARERRAAAWIIVLAMAISAIVGMALTVILQHP